MWYATWLLHLPPDHMPHDRYTYHLLVLSPTAIPNCHVIGIAIVFSVLLSRQPIHVICHMTSHMTSLLVVHMTSHMTSLLVVLLWMITWLHNPAHNRWLYIHFIIICFYLFNLTNILEPDGYLESLFYWLVAGIIRHLTFCVLHVHPIMGGVVFIGGSFLSLIKYVLFILLYDCLMKGAYWPLKRVAIKYKLFI